MFLKIGKRILAAVLLCAVCAALAGCAANTVQFPELPVPAEGETPAPADPADYDRDAVGLCLFLEASKAATGDRVQMSYDVIGAKNGYRYNYRYNGTTVQLEVYEFDPENLSEAGQKTINSLRDAGKFEVMGSTVPGTLSADGRFLLLYTDTKNDDVNREHTAYVEECFRTFTEYGAGQ